MALCCFVQITLLEAAGTVFRKLHSPREYINILNRLQACGGFFQKYLNRQNLRRWSFVTYSRSYQPELLQVVRVPTFSTASCSIPEERLFSPLGDANPKPGTDLAVMTR